MEQYKKLLDEVQKSVAADPLIISRLMQVISAGIEAFQEAEKKKRNKLADTAIQTLLAFVEIPEQFQEIHWLIDIAYCHFPEGAKNHAKCEKDFWELFLQVASEWTPDYKWIYDQKGSDCLAWWNVVVEPKLRKT